MRKIVLSFCAILAFALVSCGGNESNSSGSNINFRGKSKSRGHCSNNPYVDHTTCYKFVPHPYDARYCYTCGCSEGDHWYE